MVSFFYLNASMHNKMLTMYVNLFLGSATHAIKMISYTCINRAKENLFETTC